MTLAPRFGGADVLAERGEELASGAGPARVVRCLSLDRSLAELLVADQDVEQTGRGIDADHVAVCGSWRSARRRLPRG